VERRNGEEDFRGKTGCLDQTTKKKTSEICASKVPVRGEKIPGAANYRKTQNPGTNDGSVKKKKPGFPFTTKHNRHQEGGNFPKTKKSGEGGITTV